MTLPIIEKDQISQQPLIKVKTFTLDVTEEKPPKVDIPI